MKLRVQVRTRRQWDRYCLWLAVGGGNLAGIIWILPDLSMASGLPLPFWIFARHREITLAGDVLLFFAVICLARAPRRLLFWVPVPPALWLAWSQSPRIILGNWLGLFFNLHNYLPLASMSLACGCLIALVTGQFGRGLEEEDAVRSAASAMRFDSGEGVWPPAPNYPPQPLGRKED